MKDFKDFNYFMFSLSRGIPLKNHSFLKLSNIHGVIVYRILENTWMHKIIFDSFNKYNDVLLIEFH